MDYPGALIVVSHDRYLLQKVSNRLVILGGKEARQFPGTYDEFFAKVRNHSLSAEEQTRENELRQLEMQLTKLMSIPEPDSLEEQQSLMREIRQLHLKITEKHVIMTSILKK